MPRTPIPSTPTAIRARPGRHGWRFAPWLLALTAIALASPAGAGAEEEATEALVPPDNSAVNQYTEAFPTARGGKDVEQAVRRGRHSVRADSLGTRHKRRLEAKGPDGVAAAVVADLTAPGAPSAPEGQQVDEGSPSDERGAEGDAGEVAAAPPSSGPPSGGSGLSELISQATGSNASGASWLLPLALLATIFWAGWFSWRRRQEASAGGN
jgi:hypothetical protein